MYRKGLICELDKPDKIEAPNDMAAKSRTHKAKSDSSARKSSAERERKAREVGKAVLKSKTVSDVAHGVKNVGNSAITVGKSVGKAAVDQVGNTAEKVSDKVGRGEFKDAAKEVGRGVARTARDTTKAAWTSGKKEVGDLAGKSRKYVARRGGNALRKGRDWAINKLSTAKDRS